MATIKFEVDGKIYDFTGEKFWIDEEGNLVLIPEEKKKNPFERVKEGESFYLIGSNGDVMTHTDAFWYFIEKYYDSANYCTDAELLRRRALYEKLERCLWRFSMENGGSGNYYPILNRDNRRWTIVNSPMQRFGPSFKTKEIGERAVNEVIKPMLDGIAEKEIFVWKGV